MFTKTKRATQISQILRNLKFSNLKNLILNGNFFG